MLVWIVFFANLLNMYLFSYWMPTVLNLSGLKPEVAVFYASMQPVNCGRSGPNSA